jgi:hypothetical protein
MSNTFEELDSKSIYLKKDGEFGFIGLHSVGESDVEWIEIDFDGNEHSRKGFRAHESWGNEYDNDHVMIGRGSFRVFQDIEVVAQEMVQDGWIIFTPLLQDKK